MKGLLKKDILLATKTYKFILIVCIVLFAVRFFAEEVSVAVLLPVMFAGMLPTSLLAVDERDGWDRTAEMLPVTRAQRVGAKFLLGFLFWAVMAALSLLVEAGASLVQGNFDGSALLTMAALFAVAGLACPAITLTFGFRFGTEKARYLYFLLMAVIFAAGARRARRSFCSRPRASPSPGGGARSRFWAHSPFTGSCISSPWRSTKRES